MTFKPHPVAALFPLLTDDEFEKFVADIEARGQQQPVLLHNGRIIDGRVRLAACEKLGMQPLLQHLPGDTTEDEIIAIIVSNNLMRRHLTTSERIAIAARLVPLHKPAAAERQRAGGQKGRDSQRLGPDLTQARAHRAHERATDTAAKLMKVSGASVRKQIAVMRANPELAEQVERGKMSTDEAYQLIRGESKLDFERLLRRVFKATNEFAGGFERVRLNLYTRAQVMELRDQLQGTVDHLNKWVTHLDKWLHGEREV